MAVSVCKADSVKNYPVRIVNVLGIQSLDQIDSALRKPVDMSKSGGTLELTGNSKKVKVSTCQEYFDFKDKGYSADTTYDVTMESWFINACIPLRLLKEAKPSRVSFLAGSFLADDPLKNLPLDLSLSLSSDDTKNLQAAKEKGLTWGKFIPDATVKIIDNNQIILNSAEKGSTSVDLLAFGDFNNDGIEDALVFVSHYVTDGSYRNFSIKILTRLEKGGRIICQDIPENNHK